MVGDLLQDAAEIEFRIESVELGRSEQAINRSGAFTTGIGASKQIVLAAQRIRALRINWRE